MLIANGVPRLPEILRIRMPRPRHHQIARGPKVRRFSSVVVDQPVHFFQIEPEHPTRTVNFKTIPIPRPYAISGRLKRTHTSVFETRQQYRRIIHIPTRSESMRHRRKL